jgi:PAS domain S-box-containing protein
MTVTRILLVDDHPENLLALEAVLEPLGRTLVRAGSGEEALKRLLTDDYALILLDVQMPGMDGYETADYIKRLERTRTVPIIFLTALNTEQRHVFRGYESGAVDYLFKPFDPTVLRSKVNVFVDLYEKNAALRRSEQQLRLLVDGAQDYSLVMLDTEGRITTWNQGAERLGGLTADQALGAHIGAFYLPAEQEAGLPDADLARARAEGTYETEGTRVRGDGTNLWVLTVLTALHDDAGHPQGYSVLVRDVSERRATAERLAEAHRRLEEHAADLERSNADLSSFAYVASHDLSEPLRVVSGYVSLLRARYSAQLDEDAQGYIDFALSGTERMRGLITDLLTYSRAGASSRIDDVDTAQVARQTMLVLDRTITETGALVTAGALPVVAGDEGQLVQVFQNLIGNAIKFRRPDTPARIHIAAEAAPGGWLFSVADNGIGIEPRFGDRVFEMFQRLHAREAYPGTGIGLAICRKIIERSGGRIWAEPNPDGGTIFRFTLPDAAPRRPEAERPSLRTLAREPVA